MPNTPKPTAQPPQAAPAGAPSGSVTDPGFTVTDLPPVPDPAKPITEQNNLLTLFVPADMTTLQMGASAFGPNVGTPGISGFRVSTQNHAHITAQSPLTTISLGKPGGQGTVGPAGFDVYSDGNKDERITGPVYEEYKSTRETHVALTGTETWGGDLSIYVGGKTTETWKEAHKMNSQDTRLDEVNGECTHIFHSDLGQTMFGKVETKISKTWDQTVTGAIKIESTAGTIEISSPTKITLKAPTVQSEVSALHEYTYGFENKAGIEKGDACAMDNSVTGMKNEAVGVSMGANVIKFEKTGMEGESTGFKLEMVQAVAETHPLKFSIENLKASSGAFHAITAAFLKMG